jgi:hypothetical protein
MPQRGVGRPRGMKFCDRISVTLRIDRELWQDFQEKEALGIIEDRTALINQLIKEKLVEISTRET